MKKLSLFALVLALAAILAVSVSAGTVMLQNGVSEGYITNGSTGALVLEIKFDETFNLDDADILYVRYYIENPELFSNNGQIEITSSGTCDNEEFNWNLGSFDMQPGWNEWEIDIYSGSQTGGLPDFEKINYFRIYFFTDDENLVALDYVAFGAEDEDFSSIKNDDLSGYVREEHVAEDKVERTKEADSGVCTVQATMELTPVDATNYTYAFIRLYVEGVENFSGDGQLELTSKLTCDQQEINWNVGGLGLENGWNELMLDLDLPDSFSFDFDRSKLNFFRLYQFVSGPVKMELDYIGLGNDGDVFGEDTLPVYFVKPSSQDVPTEEPAEEEEAPAEITFGVQDATGSFDGETAANLFDHDETTKWCFDGAAITDPYVIWNVENPQNVTWYEIVTANDNESCTGRNPDAWVLSGSNDGETWTVIANVEGDTTLQDVNFTPFAFTADAAGEYSWFKFEIKHIVGEGVCQISGLNLYTGDRSAAEAAEETVDEVPAEAAPAEEAVEVAEAPQTFDAILAAGIAAIVSLAGYSVSRKH